jgi:hypothetical protein
MAPEQAQGRAREVDERTDLYSVGATMFMLLTGELPHDAETAQEMLIVVATTPARSIASVRPGSPRALVDLLDRSLAFESQRRWPDARAMQGAVRDTYALLGGGASMLVPRAGPAVRVSRDDVSDTGPTAVAAAPSWAASLAPPAARTAPPTSTGAPSPGPARRRWPIAVASVAVVLAAGVVAQRIMAQRVGSPSPAVAASQPQAELTKPTTPEPTIPTTSEPRPPTTSEATTVSASVKPVASAAPLPRSAKLAAHPVAASAVSPAPPPQPPPPPPPPPDDPLGRR